MRKPSLKEVQEYFKNAKVVRNNTHTFELKDLTIITEGYVIQSDWFYIMDNGFKTALWEDHCGYAEIIEYKNKPMRKVIRLDEPKEESKKPIELTHYQSSDGWQKAGDYINRIIKESEKIVYIGWCNQDKDMFAVYAKDGYINIAKGHLNDGVY